MNSSWITYHAFHKIGYRHHHGIDIILSSLHTRNSCGIGEFYDLCPLVDFCKKVGFDIIQLLPINDTGMETSPYMSLTSCGLNPIFLSLWKLPRVKKASLARFEKFRNLPHIAYHNVLQEKLDFLYDYYLHSPKDKGYHNFVKQHEWLKSYSLFKARKERLHHESCSSWPYDSEQKESKADFFSFLQYLCFTQMKEVKAYANHHGVRIKGDIPILISPESADVWAHRSEFNLQLAAGAPPDQYSKEGQRWGFPLYHWDVIEKTNFAWWKKRLQYAENFYDIYRLDHIIGFFRIWAIPEGKKAIEGFFIPEDPAQQKAQGLSIFSHLLPATTMLPIGEDLGFDVGIAQAAMQTMGIPGTRVMRWMRNYDTDHHFIPYDAYPELSLTTVSTHDSEPLGLWWETCPAEAKDFCSFRNIPYESALSQHTRLQILRESHHTSSLFHINLLGEYLALFDELVWENPEKERINIPGLVLATNWTYRLRPSLEDLLSHKELKKTIKSILSPLS